MWANASWGSDVIAYAVWKIGGFLGIAILGGIIVSATFFFFAHAAKLSLWDQAFLFPLLLYVEHPLNSVSFRGQQLSLLLTGILFYFLSLYHKNKKFVFLVIPLFLIWGNIHGQFILGLGLLTIWAATNIIISYFTSLDKKQETLIKEAKFWGIVTILSALSTLINPFGIDTWKFTASHFINPSLQYIAEYLPFQDQSSLWFNLILILVLAIIGSLFHFFNRSLRENLSYVVLSIILFMLALPVKRYAWTLYYVAFPLLASVVSIYTPGKKWSTFIAAGITILAIYFVVNLKNPLDQFLKMSWDSYCNQYIACSSKAAEFLVEKRQELSLVQNPNKLLSFYDWGGWMIWNYPQVKPSIDGRMVVWRNEKGYSAFEEYYPLEQNIKDIDKSGFDVVLMSPKKPVYQRLEQLAKEGRWRAVYKDEKAGIFMRTPSKPR